MEDSIILKKEEHKMLLAFHTFFAIILILWANNGVYTYIANYVPSIVLGAIFRYMDIYCVID